MHTNTGRRDRADRLVPHPWAAAAHGGGTGSPPLYGRGVGGVGCTSSLEGSTHPNCKLWENSPHQQTCPLQRFTVRSAQSCKGASRWRIRDWQGSNSPVRNTHLAETLVQEVEAPDRFIESVGMCKLLVTKRQTKLPTRAGFDALSSDSHCHTITEITVSITTFYTTAGLAACGQKYVS